MLMIDFRNVVFNRIIYHVSHQDLSTKSSIAKTLLTSQPIANFIESYQSAFLDEEIEVATGNKALFPGSLQRRHLVQAIVKLDFCELPYKEVFEPQKGLQGKSIVLLARLAAAESLPDAVFHVKTLLDYSKAIGGWEQKRVILNALQCFSVTLTQLAHVYFSRKKKIHQLIERKEGMKYLRPDYSVKSGYFKDVLDAASQFLHDATMQRNVSPLHWLNHFTLLRMGNLHEHVGAAVFDMWVESYRKWIFDLDTPHSGGEVPPLINQMNENRNTILNATAICMIEWCEKTQMFYKTSEAKRIAQIWSMFCKVSAGSSFVPNVKLIAKICDSLRWTIDTGGVVTNLFVTMQSKISFSSILHSPWKFLKSIILILPRQSAIAAIFLRHSVESHAYRKDVQPQLSSSIILPYHLLHTLLLIFIKNRSIAESEHLFRSNVSVSYHRKYSRERNTRATLAQARSVIAEDSDTRREHMILLMLSLYAYLPTPDLQSALDISETYLSDDEYTVEHFNLLLRAASHEPDMAYAIYIDGCSRGFSVERTGYDMLFYALGKGSRWVTRSILAGYEELNAREIDDYISIPEEPKSLTSSTRK